MTRRRKLLIVAVAASISAVLLIIHHDHLRAATDAYIAHLRAAGEPMDLAQVTPAPVPPEQNSADTFRQAAALLDAYPNWALQPGTNAGETGQDYTEAYEVSGMQMVATGKAMVVWQQPEIQEGKYRYAWQDITAVMAKNEKIFTLLQQIITKPDFDFQVNYDPRYNNFALGSLYLAETKRAALKLSTVAMCDLHNGDTASAQANLRAILAILQAMRNQRYTISELVRMAIVTFAADPTWELLQSPNVTDAQLAQLQQDWTKLDFVQSSENVLEMERASGLIAVAEGRYRRSYSDELRALKGYQVLIDAMRMAQTNGSFQHALPYQNENLDKLGITSLMNTGNIVTPPAWLPSWLQGPMIWLLNTVYSSSTQSRSVALWGPLTTRVIRAEVTKRMAITAIALKRYQLKHGNYPPDLKSLVPEFLPAVVLDPVDGQPLRYHPKSDGTFLLYSVGMNGKDDGGNPYDPAGGNFYWLNPHALDWVWPQPATAQEIQNYYAHPPK